MPQHYCWHLLARSHTASVAPELTTSTFGCRMGRGGQAGSEDQFGSLKALWNVPEQGRRGPSFRRRQAFPKNWHSGTPGHQGGPLRPGDIRPLHPLPQTSGSPTCPVPQGVTQGAFLLFTVAACRDRLASKLREAVVPASPRGG